jgi:hypothetical protein
MLAFIYLAYSTMALLCETVPAFEDTWIECLDDLGRYRTAIEDDDVRDCEVWPGVAHQSLRQGSHHWTTMSSLGNFCWTKCFTSIVLLFEKSLRGYSICLCSRVDTHAVQSCAGCRPNSWSAEIASSRYVPSAKSHYYHPKDQRSVNIGHLYTKHDFILPRSNELLRCSEISVEVVAFDISLFDLFVLPAQIDRLFEGF